MRKILIGYDAVDAAALALNSGFATASDDEQYRARKAGLDVLNASLPLVFADELDSIAFDVERRSDNVPMSQDGRGIEKVATLREIAAKIRDRAAEIRGE